MTYLLDTHALVWFMSGDSLFHHRDPFDRLMVGQSVVENFPIISADAGLDLYSIHREW